MLNERLKDVDPNDDDQGQELNSVDWFGSDFINSQEYNRKFVGALANHFFYRFTSGSFKNRIYSRGALILDGMEYVDLGGDQVEIKPGYFASSGFEVVYFEGGTYDISVNKYVNIRRSDDPIEIKKLFGDGNSKTFAVKYTAVVTQSSTSNSTNTISVEYNFNNLNNGDYVCELTNTAKGGILADYINGIRSEAAADGVFDFTNVNTNPNEFITARRSADGYGLEVNIRCILLGKPDSTDPGAVSLLKIADLPSGMWRNRGLNAGGGNTAFFNTPVSIETFNDPSSPGSLKSTPATIVINDLGEVLLNRAYSADGSYPAIITDSFLNTSFRVNFPTSSYGEMRNEKQWKKLDS